MKKMTKSRRYYKLRKAIRKNTNYDGELSFIEKIEVRATKFYTTENLKLLMKGEYDYGAKFIKDERILRIVNILQPVIENIDSYFEDDCFKLWGFDLAVNTSPMLNLYGLDFKSEKIYQYHIGELTRKIIKNKYHVSDEAYLASQMLASDIQDFETASFVIGKENVLNTLNYLIKKSEEGVRKVHFETYLDTNNTINTGSLRYQLFKESLECVSCNIEGSFLALQRSPENTIKNTGWHYNLYAIKDSGEVVLLTKDHIIPKSKGGKDKLSNMQCMCSQCNQKKGNDLFWIKEGRINAKTNNRNEIWNVSRNQSTSS